MSAPLKMLSPTSASRVGCPTEHMLGQYRDGYLTAAERAELAPHLDRCEQCQAWLDRPDYWLEGLARHAPPPPPPIPKYEYVLDEKGFAHVLGQGGIGVVFLARYLGVSGHPLRAVKVLHTGFQLSQRGRERFLREIEAVSELNRQGHPGFVEIYECDVYGGYLYYVMEYIPGGNLAQHLKDHPPAPRQAAQLVLGLCEIMAVAHRHGVLHRDLKPDNVLVIVEPKSDPSQIQGLKIADFSHACFLDRKSNLSQGEPVGTPNYMAPEQVRCETVDARADVYGLCAILYKMLTGVPPYQGPSASATMEMVRSPTKLPATPETLRADLRNASVRDLTSICMMGLEKDSARRYGTVEALAADLRCFLRGDSTLARPLGRLERLRRLCRRYPGAAGLVTLVFLLVLVGFPGVAFLWHRSALALQDSESREAEVQELLGELIKSGRLTRIRQTPYRRTADLELLLKTEAQGNRLLAKRPGDLEVRVALTQVRFILVDYYSLCGQPDEQDAWCKQVRELWEPLVRMDSNNLAYRNWLAICYSRQGLAAKEKAQYSEMMYYAEQAESIWFELCKEQPENFQFLRHAINNRFQLFGSITNRLARESMTSTLENICKEQKLQMRINPFDQTAQRRLACSYHLLGEIHTLPGSTQSPIPYWKVAVEYYRRLAVAMPGSVLIELPLASCCSRLFTEASAGSEYREAERVLARLGQRLEQLAERYPEENWLCLEMSHINFRLVFCHWRAGESDRAKDVYSNQLRRLDRLLESPEIDPYDKAHTLQSLAKLALSLRETKNFQKALEVARDIVTRAEILASSPGNDSRSCHELADVMLDVAAILCQIDHFQDALGPAEHALRLYTVLHRTSGPEKVTYCHGLGISWSRIAKARWGIGNKNDAIAAFREAAVFERQVFEGGPSNLNNRTALSRAFERLAYYGRECGMRKDVAHALLEIEKLWPNDKAKLQEVAEGFRELAKLTGREGNLFNVVEQQRYLKECERIRRLAAD